MECHKCPERKKIEAGQYARMPYSETPCAKCELKENSEYTMEYEPDRETGSQSAVGSEQMAENEERLPISVMNEVVFRLLSMPPEIRDVLCWRFAGMPYRDIAVLQGVTMAAVEKRHWQAMKKWPALRAMFATKLAKHGRRKPAGSGQRTVGGKENSRGRRMKFEKGNY